MRRLITFTIAIGLILLGVISCQPEDVKPVGEPVNIISAMAGNWTVSKVIQFDNDAVKKGFPYQQLDITDLYPYTTMKLTLNTDGSGQPSTFTFDPGSSPSLIPIASGNWEVDDELAPKTINLSDGTNEAEIEVGNYTTLRENELVLKVVKKLSDKPVVTYEYHFKK
ncbi:hypothetical protein C3K47_06445 [Solitalea longa]|uniref:DUF5004 domain-containing protein n=1 Tax=Solitalea longa TaxID=2079460 RepID=A0A2S5A532_9SPHI|nr:DUF5004 domain-containing protein [Solitalea longa]POY37397.1 hypothetical protein C3K47_06445 [Solitalea longa]